MQRLLLSGKHPGKAIQAINKLLSGRCSLKTLNDEKVGAISDISHTTPTAYMYVLVDVVRLRKGHTIA